MKIPLYNTDFYNPEQAQRTYDLYVTRMAARQGAGFRRPIGYGSKRIRPRQGLGKAFMDGLQMKLAGLLMVAGYGGNANE